MSAKNAQIAAEEFVLQIQLVDSAGGGRFQLVTFDNDEDCRFFYPRRALDWQRQVNTYIARALRRRGVRIERITLGPPLYHAWRKERADTQELRREFADQYLRLVD